MTNEDITKKAVDDFARDIEAISKRLVDLPNAMPINGTHMMRAHGFLREAVAEINRAVFYTPESTTPSDLA